jgi:hypothetical protein
MSLNCLPIRRPTMQTEDLIINVLKDKKIVLIKTNDQYTTLKCGSTGVINYVDDTGTIFAKWEDGSSLGLLPGIDQFAIFFT